MSLSKLQPEDRFEDITDKLVVQKHFQVQKKNMKKNEKSAEKQLRDYLLLKACEHTRFWEFEANLLDSHLSHFWFAARQNKIDQATNKPKKYKVQSLKTLRYVLNRILKEKNYDHDIITSPAFRKSQTAFTDACKELKQQGYGYVKQTAGILPEGTELITFYHAKIFSLHHLLLKLDLQNQNITWHQ